MSVLQYRSRNPDSAGCLPTPTKQHLVPPGGDSTLVGIFRALTLDAIPHISKHVKMARHVVHARGYKVGEAVDIRVT